MAKPRTRIRRGPRKSQVDVSAQWVEDKIRAEIDKAFVVVYEEHIRHLEQENLQFRQVLLNISYECGVAEAAMRAGSNTGLRQALESFFAGVGIHINGVIAEEDMSAEEAVYPPAFVVPTTASVASPNTFRQMNEVLNSMMAEMGIDPAELLARTTQPADGEPIDRRTQDDIIGDVLEEYEDPLTDE